MKRMKQKEFHFYLDAWLWCKQTGIDFIHDNMVKKDFKTWILRYNT